MNPRDARSSHDTANVVSEAEDRRLHPRYTVQVPIEIHLEGSNTPLSFSTTDLSRGGCYIQITPQFALGKAVRATLWLDGFPAVIHCLVVTRHPEFGNGIMFMKFEGEGERLLARYLDAIIA
jgi:hypothetical protein